MFSRSKKMSFGIVGSGLLLSGTALFGLIQLERLERKNFKLRVGQAIESINSCVAKNPAISNITTQWVDTGYGDHKIELRTHAKDVTVGMRTGRDYWENSSVGQTKYFELFKPLSTFFIPKPYSIDATAHADFITNCQRVAATTYFAKEIAEDQEAKRTWETRPMALAAKRVGDCMKEIPLVKEGKATSEAHASFASIHDRTYNTMHVFSLLTTTEWQGFKYKGTSHQMLRLDSDYNRWFSDNDWTIFGQVGISLPDVFKELGATGVCEDKQGQSLKTCLAATSKGTGYNLVTQRDAPDNVMSFYHRQDNLTLDLTLGGKDKLESGVRVIDIDTNERYVYPNRQPTYALNRIQPNIAEINPQLLELAKAGKACVVQGMTQQFGKADNWSGR